MAKVKRTARESGQGASLGKAQQRSGPLRPNMLASNLPATSSTFDRVSFDHCLHNSSSHAGSLFLNTDFKSACFERSTLDGTILQRCSLRGVQLQNCNVDGLVINGVRVGDLIKAVMYRRGGE